MEFGTYADGTNMYLDTSVTADSFYGSGGEIAAAGTLDCSGLPTSTPSTSVGMSFMESLEAAFRQEVPPLPDDPSNDWTNGAAGMDIYQTLFYGQALPALPQSEEVSSPPTEVAPKQRKVRQRDPSSGHLPSY